MIVSGVMFGFAAAASQSASYVFSRLFVIRRQQAVIRLLVWAHLVMTLLALAILPFAWSSDMPPLRAYWAPLLGTTVTYLLGQAGFFVLVRQIDASRAAPLLGVKILVLALITAFVFRRPLAPMQWAAVGLCATSAVMLNATGGSLPRQAIGWLLLVCVFFSLSDINIERLVHALVPLNRIRASVVGVCLSYVICGVLVLGLVPWLGRGRAMSDWLYAFPFAVFWFLGMVFLYCCFASIGVVYGNILQATRGILSIVAGAVLARMGLEHLEQRVTRGIFAMRLAAAVLMALAIGLFQMSAARP